MLKTIPKHRLKEWMRDRHALGRLYIFLVLLVYTLAVIPALPLFALLVASGNCEFPWELIEEMGSGWMILISPWER